MNFLVFLGNQANQEQLVVNSDSWSSCLAYCEGTQIPINSITLIPNAIINYNTSGTTCYSVSLKTNNGTTENHYVWENNFNDLYTWLESQDFQSVTSIQFSNKSYVVV